MMKGESMIVVKDLVKSFGDKQAVKGISFSVEKGEILGFLGPNGAGKSTTMKILTGFLGPTSGEVYINGVSVFSEPITTKKLIGYLPETSASYQEMNVVDFLEFIAEVRGFRGSVLKARVQAVIEKCFLETVKYQVIETLSKGFRQRVGFAQAILHDPPILVLDEPTDGLDPNQKHEIRRLIKEMGRDKCIILSTHILEEADAVCDRMIIISEGRVVADGKLPEIRAKSPHLNSVELGVHKVDKNLVIDKLKGLSCVKAVEFMQSEDGLGRFRITPHNRENIMPALSGLIAGEKWVIEELSLDRGRLDEVFRELTTEDR
jgi:ABC-2 type transport system ATP-binding protein